MLELYDCADFYQLKKMQAAVWKGINSGMDESNFYERLVAAERCGNDLLYLVC